MAFADKNYWIIGASSGIGASLAHELASRGARVAVSARRTDMLDDLVAQLGPNYISAPMDIAQLEHIQNAASVVQSAFTHIDGIILLSAVYTPMSFKAMDITEARKIVDINITGTLNCLHVVLPILRAQKGGQIALCGSVAGYCGLPNAQPYSATKAAIINMAQTLRLEEKPNGIDVRLINPGFVRTQLTDKNDFQMPMMIEPEEAAKALADQLAGSGFEIHFPKKCTWIMKIISLLPYRIYFAIAKNFS